MVLFVFLAKGEPSFELVTLFLDILDLIDHEIGLGLVGPHHEVCIGDIAHFLLFFVYFRALVKI